VVLWLFGNYFLNKEVNRIARDEGISYVLWGRWTQQGKKVSISEDTSLLEVI
jgi:TolB-like protein